MNNDNDKDKKSFKKYKNTLLVLSIPMLLALIITCLVAGFSVGNIASEYNLIAQNRETIIKISEFFIGLENQSTVKDSEVSTENSNTFNELDINNFLNETNFIDTANNNLDNSTVNIFDNVSNSVVSINTLMSTTTRFGQKIEGEGAGSGVIIYEDDKKVYIVTNEHVLSGSSSVTISLDDNVRIATNFVGSESASDIAVISANKSDFKNANINYKIAVFADSDKAKVGQDVLAIGNAAGTGKSATKGIISALNKIIQVDTKTLEMIQTDAAINPGNSGGALVNMNGEIVGINTAKFSELGIEGMGYSIPSNKAQSLVKNIITASGGKSSSTNSVKTAYLGIQGYDVTEELSAFYSIPKGILISAVQNNSPAYVAGIESRDIITGFDGKSVENNKQLDVLLSSKSAGDIVEIEIYRNGYAGTVEVTLGNLAKQKL